MKKINTVYIGGGTPSMVPPAVLEKISGIWKNQTSCKEITLEVNPNSLRTDDLFLYNKLGINRISMGIQSFNQDIRRSMGRREPEKGLKGILDMVEKHWTGRFSIDLIYGYPGTQWKDWISDVDRAAQHNIEHLSLYQLTLENGTPLAKLLSKKETKDLLDYQDDYWPQLRDYLSFKDYKRYEISNFSRDEPSYHNLHYWNMDPWIGLGPGAWSHLNTNKGHLHLGNRENLEDFLSLGGGMPLDNDFYIKNYSGPKDYTREMLMMGLRSIYGVKISALKENGLIFPLFLDHLKQWIHSKDILVDKNIIKPSVKSMDRHNQLQLYIMECLDNPELWSVNVDNK
jgi:oxygen-independent coproporphyrinogen-3 oxidase